jgi:hypothetical protein
VIFRRRCELKLVKVEKSFFIEKHEMVCGLSSVYGWIIVVVLVLVVAALIVEIVTLRKIKDTINSDTYNFLLIMNVIMTIAAAVIVVLLVISLLSGSALNAVANIAAAAAAGSTAGVSTPAPTTPFAGLISGMIAKDSLGSVVVKDPSSGRWTQLQTVTV